LEPAVKAKMLTLVLPTEKRLVVCFILDIFSNLSATKVNWKEQKPPKCFVDAGVSFYSKTAILQVPL